jgi:3-phenylpropionate/trans-cinnamate dioxygenase ferredoxin component
VPARAWACLHGTHGRFAEWVSGGCRTYTWATRGSREKGAEELEDFIHLTTTEGIESGGLKAAELDEHEFLVANVGAEYFIGDGRCPHMGGFLPDGTLDGTVITCPRHHSQFDLRDGRNLRWTDWEGIKSDVGKLLRHPRPLRMYEVKIDGTDVFVGPQKAPPVQE